MSSFHWTHTTRRTQFKMNTLQQVILNAISLNEMRVRGKQERQWKECKSKSKKRLKKFEDPRLFKRFKTEDDIEQPQQDYYQSCIKNENSGGSQLQMLAQQILSDKFKQEGSQIQIQMGNIGQLSSENTNNNYAKMQQKQKKSENQAQFSDSSDSSGNEEGQSKMIDQKLKKIERLKKRKGREDEEAEQFEEFLKRQLMRYINNLNVRDPDLILQNRKYVELLTRNMIQRQAISMLTSRASRVQISNQLLTQQYKLLYELNHIQNQHSKHIFNKITARNKEIKAYMDKRKELRQTCPIIKKIQDIELIKCGKNPYLNIKDIKKDDAFSIYKKGIDWSDMEAPQPIITMDDLDEGQQPHLKIQELIMEQQTLGPEIQDCYENQVYIREKVVEMIQIQRSIRKENNDETSAMKRELAKQERIKFEQKVKKNEEMANEVFVEEENRFQFNFLEHFGDVPLSLEEKSKYGYGFDVSKYKEQPKRRPFQPMGQIKIDQEEIARQNELIEDIQGKQKASVPQPELLHEEQEFDLQRGFEDYRHVKEELYLDKNTRIMEDVVKQEDEHMKNPKIDYSLMKVLRLDEEAQKYLEQKYYKNSLSGLMGKIFDMDDSKIDPIAMPGQMSLLQPFVRLLENQEKT